MKPTAAGLVPASFRFAAIAFALVLSSSAYAQGGIAKTAPCTVDALRLRIVTGGDDLRGGTNNLNLAIRWGTNGFQGVPNVNNGAEWQNGSTHVVDIRLNQPVPLSEIKSISLDHLANGGLSISATTVLSPIGVLAGLKTADNWDMLSVEVTAVGSGVGAIIFRHGAKRFTGSDAVLNMRADILPTACGSSSGSGGGMLNPGGTGSGMLPNAGAPRGIATTPGTPGAAPSGARPTQQQLNARFARPHSLKGKLTPIVTNPASSQASQSMLGLLQQQKQIALSERGQSAPSGGSSGTVTPTAGTARMTLLRGPVSTTAAPAPSSNFGSTTALRGTNIAVSCATYHGPIITAVSGQQGSSAVFTQDPQYNLFTIRGCNFGQTKGQSQLNSSNGRKLADLTIDTWTDTLITAEVPATLSGALDQSNVSLVLFPGTGPQVQKSGFRFYAKRAELHLTAIPAGQVALASTSDDGGSPVQAKLSSPFTVSTGSMSGGVDRTNVVRFPGGTDVFDFSRLKPGFTVEKFQVNQLSNASCSDLGPTTTTAYTDGSWNSQMSGNTIRVTWQEQHCHDAYFGDASDASYGLDVWLTGPVLGPGESPWQDGVN